MSNTKQKVTITIVAVVLVLAVVTVAALAIAGVFGKRTDSTPVATAEGAVEESQVIRAFNPETELYLSSNFTGNPADVVKVRDSSGNPVLVKALPDGGVKPVQGWVAGMSYTVSLSDSRYTFAGGQVDGLSSFVCTVAKASAQVFVEQEGLIYLSAGDYELDGDTLTVFADPGSNPVFVIKDGLNSRSLKLGNEKYIAKNGNRFTMTVVDAAVEDVYASIDFTQTYTLANAEFIEDAEATLASFLESDFYLAAMEALYGDEALFDIKALSNEWVSTSIDFDHNGLESFDVNLTVKFKGIIKKNGQRDPNSSITVKIANNLAPQIDVNIQSEGDKKAFDVAVDLNVHTAASVIAEYTASSGRGDEDNLQKVALKLVSVAKEWLGDKAGMDNSKSPYIFGHWQFPIGTLPICIDYKMGVEIKAEFAGQIGVTATNDLALSFGAVYADGRLQGFHNVEDQFKMGSLSMLGTAGLKVGLVNMIGISAYGVVTVDLDVSFGPYVDLAGKLDVDLDQLMQGKVDVVPAYYLESGAYIDLKLQGKVFKWTIAEMQLLSKKFPLFTLGNKYIPVTADYEGWPSTDGVKDINPFVDETVYMSGSYFYLTGYDVMALDIQSIGTPFVVTLGYDQFIYEPADASLLTIDGNKVKVGPTSPAQFETTIKVTNKTNKAVVKTLTVIKNPELPTVAAGQESQTFDKSAQFDVNYPVLLNGSAFQAVYLDGVRLANVGVNDEIGLTLPRSAMSGLSYGSHRVLVESNKGYLALDLQVVNSAAMPKSIEAAFDKKSASAVILNVDLQGKEIASFADGNFTYRQSTSTLTIPASYLMSKNVGLNSLLLTLASGEEIQVNITILDNRQALLKTTSYEYLAGSGDLKLDVELFGNEISGLLFDGVSLPASDTISAAVLAGKSSGNYQGKLIAGSASFDFSVTIAESNLMVVPVKYASYDKASGNDLHLAVLAPAGKSVSLSGCDAASFADGILTIPASFLQGLPVGEWKGELSGKGIDNRAELTILVSNSGKPMLTSAASIIMEDDKNCQFSFNWQGIDPADVSVEGLDASQFELKGNVLTVKVASLPFGLNRITVFTPVNALSLSVTRKGTAALTKDSVTIDKTNPQEASFELQLAHESLVEVKLLQGGRDLGLVPTNYRFNGSSIILANELIYNLEEGNYTVQVVLSESTLEGSLRINGQLNTYKAIGSGDGITTPYLIYTAEQLADLGNTKEKKSEIYNKNFKLMADIDMTGIEMQPIGDKQQPYTGIFDGNGYSIYNLKITKSVDLKIDGEKIGAAIGLFAFNEGTIKNLRLVNPVVEVADHGSISAGILAGFNGGNIEGIVIVDGSISATSKSWLNLANAYFDLGALVGTNEGGVIRTVNVTADIKGPVKGVNIFGVQIFGRKSYINAGAVVGYATAGDNNNGKLVNISVVASMEVSADNNSINNNGWYGFTDIEFNANDIKRVHVSIN